MANENKDVIRVSDAAANFTGTKLRDKMIGMTSDTDQIVWRTSGSAYKFVSDDTQQVLIAGAQTITGAKTFSAATIFNGALTTNDDIEINLNDNDADALLMQDDSANEYFKIDTTTGTKLVEIGANALESSLNTDNGGMVKLLDSGSGTAIDITTGALSANSSSFILGTTGNPSVKLSTVTGSIGFLGATPSPLLTVSGSRGGNAALANLLTHLATYGLIVDSSS